MNKKTNPRVSIGMPVYNGEQYIEEALRTNLAQTFDDFILYIADNASTDRTEEICRDFAAKDERIVYIRNTQNYGASKNYSICFNPAKSEYFRWTNADDTVEPTLIEQCINFLDDNPGYVLAYGKTRIIDLKGEFIENYDDMLDLPQQRASDRFKSFYENVGLSNVFYGLMRREALAKTALLQSYAASDINLIGELLLYGKYKELDDYLFDRRMHPGASSWDRADSEKQKEFWDPNRKSLQLNTFRKIYEYYKGAGRAPIGALEKLYIFIYITKIVYWDKKVLADEIINYKL